LYGLRILLMKTNPKNPEARITFKKCKSPEVSIIILTFNKVEYTKSCLESIRANADVSYELILVDNGSEDGTQNYLSLLDNVTIIKNQTNLGFVKGCNQGAEKARADYVLFLNNDTEIKPNSLSSLLNTIRTYPDCGAVGCKLILPNGALQEAGSIIWSDGSTLGYGRGRNPEDPECSYLREVDYCSAACLLVRKDLFKKLGGFDERYEPAYYEDADLCMGIWQLGHKVVFQPDASITHNEFTSSTVDKAKGLMERNRESFVDKWKTGLQRQFEYSPKNIFLARDSSKQKRILVIDDRVPTPDQGCGFPRAYAMLEILATLGYKVTFCPVVDTTPYQPFLGNLQQQGLEIMYGEIDYETFFVSRAGLYDVVVISRPPNMDRMFAYAKQFFPEAALIYDAEALFFIRDELKAKLNGKEAEREIREIRENEFKLIKLADSIITVSEPERDSICDELPCKRKNVFVWGHPLPLKPTERSFKKRKDILFVGSFLAPDSPNEDAILHFIKDVFPKVRKEVDCDLYVVGAKPPDRIKKLASSNIHIEGFVEDLSKYYDSCRLFVVPHRYSAGIPLKLCEAMSYGLPAVVSGLTAPQLSLTDSKEVMVGRSTEEFAEKVIKLYTDETLWTEVRNNELSYVKKTNDPKALKENLRNIISSSIATERIIYLAKDALPAESLKIVIEQIKKLRDNGRNAGLILLSESVPFEKRIEVPLTTYGYQECPQVVESLKNMSGKKIATDWLSAFILSNDPGGDERFYLVADIETKTADNLSEVRAIFRAYDLGLAIITMSAWAQEQLLETFGYDTPVVPPGIDTKVFYERDVKRDSNKILYADDQFPAGGRDVFSKAIEYAFASEPGLTLTTISQGPSGSYRDIPHSIESSLSDEQMAELFSSAACFVSSSYHESFGVLLLEAMACGCPVVTTRADGNETFCVHEVNCLMADKGDYEGLGKAILRIHTDEQLRDSLIKNGLDTAKRYDWKTSMSKLEKALGLTK